MTTTTTDINPDLEHDDERGDPARNASEPSSDERTTRDTYGGTYRETVYADDKSGAAVGNLGIRCDATIFGADGLTVDAFSE